MGAIESPNKWAELIRPEQIHGSMYSDPAIFQEELEKIWYKTWVYVGHASEIPNPNDYVMKSIGPQPVIMTRDKDGNIHLLQNRCAHRGNEVTVKQRGNARSFTCHYHGWSFNNTGELRTMPFPSGYEGVDKSKLSLGRVPRMASYQGFVFGSFAAEGPTLEEHLGAAKETLDRLALNSPEGEVAVTPGCLKHQVRANWKFLVENETDGYHPAFTHASIFEVSNSKIGDLYGDNSVSLCRYLGNGHSEIDPRPEFRRRGALLSWFGTTADRLPDYVAKMKAAYGEEKANQIMIDGTPHVMIFPNLFIAEIQVFSIQALAVNESVQHVTALQFKGAPDLNRRMRQQTMGSVGPAGLLLADDGEMYERTQRGVQMKNPEWVFLGRGKKREHLDENGFMVGTGTDEVGARGMWSHYRSMMEAK